MAEILITRTAFPQAPHITVFLAWEEDFGDHDTSHLIVPKGKQFGLIMSRKSWHLRYNDRGADADEAILEAYPQLEKETIGVIRADGCYVCNWAWVEEKICTES
jgi:hypothetical protein